MSDICLKEVREKQLVGHSSDGDSFYYKAVGLFSDGSIHVVYRVKNSRGFGRWKRTRPREWHQIERSGLL